ncbi:hypothetical protein CTEN210_07675 [Chaetoceros tenuissimus]|uniref:Methyltransferase domain-containing protein n=1 Tax=Chaetoceros tenuissimus TaxID=426638 RepID=A0AAD3H600_9STRA|nr:hypothetical protein CTEN210_07675 [Chaetoceros tenuissimus]
MKKICLLLLFLSPRAESWNLNQPQQRRNFISNLLFNEKHASATVASILLLPTVVEGIESDNSQTQLPKIFTDGYGKEEYTNSITASRDTNISPKEVYDSIQSSYISESLEKAKKDGRTARILDAGAGAGVSTQTLYNMGFKNQQPFQIEAIDWSSKAWDENVNEKDLPSNIKFYELDDERYVQDVWRANKMEKFDVIVFNFGINDRKARYYAKYMLTPETGRLFAPVNIQNDYWLKQAFKVYDDKGDILWSVNDVGAWSVQFQPDVTADTCQGIWCAQYNGFKKRR